MCISNILCRISSFRKHIAIGIDLDFLFCDKVEHKKTFFALSFFLCYRFLCYVTFGYRNNSWNWSTSRHSLNVNLCTWKFCTAIRQIKGAVRNQGKIWIYLREKKNKREKWMFSLLFLASIFVCISSTFFSNFFFVSYSLSSLYVGSCFIRGASNRTLDSATTAGICTNIANVPGFLCICQSNGFNFEWHLFVLSAQQRWRRHRPQKPSIPLCERDFSERRIFNGWRRNRILEIKI